MTRVAAKLAGIRAGPYRQSDFIIADAKDAGMGSGITGPGPQRLPDGTTPCHRTRAGFFCDIVAVIEQDIVDAMVVSAANLELPHERGASRVSAVKPAIRANEATDCWSSVRHASYVHRPSRPFRSANLARVMHGTTQPMPGALVTGTDLRRYSVAFVNDLDDDLRPLEAFAVFLLQRAAGAGGAGRVRPATDGGRARGGVGTTRDTFEPVSQAERHGARVVLLGRKINPAEAPLPLIALMRQVADETIGPEEAVRAYHGALQTLGIRQARAIENDRAITEAPLMPGAPRHAA